MHARRPLTAAIALLLAFAIPARAVAAIPEITVIDIYPGEDGYSYALDNSTTGQAVVGNRIFFAADSASGSSQLWVSDGTTAGTHLVKAINPSGDDQVNYIVPFGDGVMFRAYDVAHQLELWISDGTESGTHMVKDINAIMDADAEDGRTFTSYPQNLYVWNGVLYFAANDGFTGVELWKSDGTETGTVLVKNIADGNGHGYPSDFMALGSRLLFTAQNETYGNELWSTDGTEAGTQLVKDINPTGDSYPFQLVKSGNAVFFMAETDDNGYELWKTDGTESGTLLVADLVPGSQQGYISGSTLTAFNGGVVFRRSDFGGTTGSELWKSDGTAAGTVIVKDINPGAGHAVPESLSVMGNYVYFSANDGTVGTELWRSDGTAAGTELVKDIWEGSDAGGTPIENSGIVSNGVHAYFFAEAPNGVDGTSQEIWRTDGTAAGTVQIGIVGLHSQSFCDGCNNPAIVIAGNRVFFRTWTETAFNELGTFVDDSLPSTNRDGGIGAQLLVLAAGLTAAASLAVRLRERRAN
jgi:ELWxxDGT repeat protein